LLQMFFESHAQFSDAAAFAILGRAFTNWFSALYKSLSSSYIQFF